MLSFYALFYTIIGLISNYSPLGNIINLSLLFRNRFINFHLFKHQKQKTYIIAISNKKSRIPIKVNINGLYAHLVHSSYIPQRPFIQHPNAQDSGMHALLMQSIYSIEYSS